jgi:hypothetical protein
MGRAAVSAHVDLKHGLNTLATLTSIAPFVGIFGTVRAIGFDTFLGLGNERSTGLAIVAERISMACVPAALGLLVGLHSLWCYNYCRCRLAELDHEMENESLQVVNHLTRQVGRLHSGRVDRPLPFLEAYSVMAGEDRRGWRRSMWAAVALLAFAWGIQVIGYFDDDALPIDSAMRAAFRSVSITVCCCSVPAYAIWVDFLHRKSTGLPWVAAVFCLSWCAAGLLFPVLRF